MSNPGSVKNSMTNLSHSNVAGSKSNLANGKNSRFTSMANVSGTKEQDVVIPTVQKNVQYENTYQLKPSKKFQTEPVRHLVQEILESKLSKVKYDQNQVADLIRALSDEILAAVKKLGYERYKIVVDVNIGEFKSQGIRIGSRCLWDTTSDNFASVTYKNPSLFAVVLVFGLYFE